MNGLIPAGMAETGPWRLVLFSVYLGICAVQDLRVRRISIPLSAAAGAAALLSDLPLLAEGRLDPVLFAAGLLPGILLLLLFAAAEGAAGPGDGICFLVAGLALGSRAAWTLVMTSLLLASTGGILLVVIRKARGKTRLPFLSFAGLAWILLLPVCGQMAG